METTVIIALITALAAIVTPVITVAMNNHNALKLKRIESHQERLKTISLHEREILENALSGIGILMGKANVQNTTDACRCITRAIAYVDDKTGDDLRSIVDKCLVMDKYDITMQVYSDICKALKNEISRRTEV